MTRITIALSVLATLTLGGAAARAEGPPGDHKSCMDPGAPTPPSTQCRVGLFLLGGAKVKSQYGIGGLTPAQYEKADHTAVRTLLYDAFSLDLNYGYGRKFHVDGVDPSKDELKYSKDFTVMLHYEVPLDTLFRVDAKK
jgi:hypothetical protein